MSWGLLQGVGQGLQQAGDTWFRAEIQRQRDEQLAKIRKQEMKEETAFRAEQSQLDRDARAELNKPELIQYRLTILASSSWSRRWCTRQHRVNRQPLTTTNPTGFAQKSLNTPTSRKKTWPTGVGLCGSCWLRASSYMASRDW